jgi:hypothetical protein
VPGAPLGPDDPSLPSAPGEPDGPRSPFGPEGPGIGTGTSARSGRSATAFDGSGATGVFPSASTCARNARTSPANVDTASPRKFASAIASARVLDSR